jgi:hypothetical protein
MIKIFALNDMEYWAGETLEACIEQAMADSGEPREVVYDPDVAYEMDCRGIISKADYD